MTADNEIIQALLRRIESLETRIKAIEGQMSLELKITPPDAPLDVDYVDDSRLVSQIWEKDDDSGTWYMSG